MTQPNEILGTKLRIAGFGCLGTVPPERLVYLLSQIVALVRMSTGGMLPKIWTYPLPDGTGGEGQTTIQPLVESFLASVGFRLSWWKRIILRLIFFIFPPGILALDTWPILSSGPKVYVILASCRPFSMDAVASYLAKEIGPVVRQGSFEI